MKIKICGLSRQEDIAYVNESLPDYIGFVFAKSKRQVSLLQAKALKAKLNRQIQAVGVFVDEDLTVVQKAVDEKIIDMVQLHGKETDDYIEKINAPVIKAIRVGDKISEQADFLLFDSATAGSGQTFDWTRIPKTAKPFFIAGGIDIYNVEQVKLLHPFGIDISSGVETDGIKDKIKIKEMVRSVRNVKR
ncbi:phosphoribosylanthranilate isomerase [Anaerotignum sp.]|uniref:phosphoribosylanthranilate isomerase n=1 Tax=Anaerotignum sp. TaxID=2039241 RepID=UPI00331C0082